MRGMFRKILDKIRSIEFGLNVNTALLVFGLGALIAVGSFFVWWNVKSIEILNNKGTGAVSGGLSPLSGIVCENSDYRPIAIMLAADPVARPLSGLSEADMVFEMPVNGTGITRLMAVYQCRYPKEIGSIRSAREDFIPLVLGLDAFYVHWGGEKVALEKLNGGITDNIDGMKYEGTVFYRKKGKKPPHNGFTDFNLIKDTIENLNYRKENKFSGYAHNSKPEMNRSLSNLASVINIDYQEPYNIRWVYDQDKKVYLRSRGNETEIDANNNEQVSAGVIVVMETTSKVLNIDYMNVAVTGGGPARIYQEGVVMNGRWSKSETNLSGKLTFTDNNGKEVEFLPGTIWVEIVSK